jgi:hypothetical protein
MSKGVFVQQKSTHTHLSVMAEARGLKRTDQGASLKKRGVERLIEDRGTAPKHLRLYELRPRRILKGVINPLRESCRGQVIFPAIE